MIDLKDLRENPDKYRRGAQLKNVTIDVDAILALDEKHRAAQREFEQFRSEQNEASKEIGKLKDPAAKQAAIARVSEVKGKVKDAEERAKVAEAELMPLLLQVPQPPDDDVPPGKDASDNVLERKWGEPRKFEFKPKSHLELGESLGLVDFQAGVRLAGSRSYYLKGVGAELQSAVLRMAMEMMIREKGFTSMSVPVLVREEAMRGTGFFPAGREQSYHVAVDDLFLTGTAEVGLTAYHIGETLDEASLPRKYTAVSTCFRREAGTYGKDTAGLYRVHQFEKCEQVVICRNDVEESKRWNMEMLGYSEELLQRLKLPYRVIRSCTGDIGVKNAAMFDIETWMPSRLEQGKPDSAYGETHSASRLYDFQARRLNLRYKDKDGKLKFCHTLNNTVVASPRILIPILENYQNADGSVTIPDVLRPYMNGRERIEKERLMLKSQLLHPQILHALGRAGHGAKVLISDGNYPHWPKQGPNAEVVFLNLAPGQLLVTDVLRALLTAIPVEKAEVMDYARTGPHALSADPPIWDEFRKLFREAGVEQELVTIERFNFYNSAGTPDVCLTVATGDQRIYANLLLTIGVVKPSN